MSKRRGERSGNAVIPSKPEFTPRIVPWIRLGPLVAFNAGPSTAIPRLISHY